jgi:hypothetical protein
MTDKGMKPNAFHYTTIMIGFKIRHSPHQLLKYGGLALEASRILEEKRDCIRDQYHPCSSRCRLLQG